MRATQAICLVTSIVYAPTAWATDETRSETKAVALASNAVASEAIPSTVPADTKHIRGFFGYLEFDFDPDALGGVPGFGTTPKPAPVLAKANQ